MHDRFGSTRGGLKARVKGRGGPADLPEDVSPPSDTPPRVSLVWSAAAVAVSGAVCTLAFAPFAWPHVLWIALVPALVALEANPPGRAALLGLLHGTVYAAGISAWLVPTVRDYFGHSLPFTLGFQVVFWMATVGVYHGALFGALSCARRGLPRAAWLALVPAAWVAADLARTSLGLRSPWARLGDAFWEAERLRQLASVTGVYGLSALVVLGNLAVAEALRAGVALRGRPRRPAWRLALGVGLVFCLVLGASLGHGRRRLDRLAADVEGAPEEGFEVLLVQGNVESSLRWRRVHASRVLRRYAGLTRQALAREPDTDLVVWPEQALQTAPDDAVYGPPLHGLVERLGRPLLLGAPRHEPAEGGSRVYNAAFLLRPGAAPAHYDKLRLLPFSETHPLDDWLGGPDGDLGTAEYAAGTRPGLLAWGGPPLGVLICFEAVYPEMARSLAQGGARVLVNIANDGWFRGSGGQEQHLAQVTFRAIETGLPLVRVTNTGISGVIGPDGGVGDRLGADRSGVLRARVTPGPVASTLYSRVGDAFAFACLAAVAVALAVSVRRPLRR